MPNTAEIAILITDNITTNGEQAVTAAKVRTVLDALNTKDYNFITPDQLSTVSEGVDANAQAIEDLTDNTYTKAQIDIVTNMTTAVTVSYPTDRSGTAYPTGIVTASFFGEYGVYTSLTDSRRLKNVKLKTYTTGTITLGLFRIVSTTATLLYKQAFTVSSTGIYTIPRASISTDLTTLEAGGKVYYAILYGTTGIARFVDLTTGGSSYSFSGAIITTATATTNNYNFSYWIETGTDDLPSPLVAAVQQATSDITSIKANPIEINLVNCNKIVCIGDSYTESFYCLKQKSWINILSSFTDWNFENYGISGFQMPQLIAGLRNNTPSYEGVAPRDYNGTYAIIASHTNDYTAGIINSTVKLETYLTNFRTLCRIVKSLGMIPVLCSEWVNIAIPNATASYSDLLSTSLSMLADEVGGIFIDVLTKAQPLQGALSTPFYGGNHPGTRSNSLIWKPLLKELESKLPRPTTSLKIFRKRSAASVSTVADLFFRDKIERNKIFQEIQVSENRIADSQANYYDDLDTWVTVVGAGRQTTRESEYLKLRKGVVISLPVYSLVSCVLPHERKNITELSLTIGDSTVVIYYKDVLNDVWVVLANNLGVATLTLTDINKGIEYDKIDFLLVRTAGSWTTSNVKVNCSGIGGKNLNYSKKKEITDFSTAELFTNQTVSSLTGWTVTGTLTPTVDSTGTLPTGTTNYVELTNTNYLEQSISFATSNVKRRLQVKAWVRRFPPKFIYTGSFPTDSTIKLDTYDFATLEISIKKNATNIAYSKGIVSLWNDEIVIECDVPPNETSLTIGFKCPDSTIQFTWASARIS